MLAHAMTQSDIRSVKDGKEPETASESTSSAAQCAKRLYGRGTPCLPREHSVGRAAGPMQGSMHSMIHRASTGPSDARHVGEPDTPAAMLRAAAVEESRAEAETRREERKAAKRDVVAEATKGSNQLKYRNPNPLLPQHPSRLCIAGATGTGKSFWLIDVLQHPDMPWDRVIWCSPERSLQQPILVALKEKMGPRLELVAGHPELGITGEAQRTIEKLIKDGRTAKKDTRGKRVGKLGMQQLIVLDDMMNVSKDGFFTDLFVSGRHDNLSVAELSQRVFLPGKGNRTRRLNCDYFVLFHFSAVSELRNLFAQLDPENQEEVLQAYKRSVRGRPTGSYFMIDLISPRSTDADRRKLKYRDSSLTKVYPALGD